ncbi:MAG TPA: polyphosphate kinase 1 [Myxococcales bacterium]|nr:polyphosphate kinase 1 [Myxococcales bacterium]
MDTVSALSSSSDALEPVTGDPKHFINRELSTLAFLERVLEEASDPQLPLLERLRFLSILSVSFDEFFMIRVAALKQQLSGHVAETGPDAMTPAEQLHAVSRRCHELIGRQDRVFREEVLTGLERAGVRLFRGQDLSAESSAAVAEYFEQHVLPVLTPLAIDPAHPFPHLRNKSLNLVIRFAVRPGARLHYGVVPVPSLLPRLVPVPGGAVLLEDVIAQHLGPLFPEMPIEGCWAFRVTRNWDLTIDEEEAEDLLVTIEREVRRRDRGSAVRLQINASAEEPTSRFLAHALNLSDADVYHQDRPLAISEVLGGLMAMPQVKHLQDEPFTPTVPAALGDLSEDLFDAIRAGDVLLHHPYESFEPVVSFVDFAADDPAVLAIKMTLYRAGHGSPIVRALQRAAENGKQVTVLVELKARMDEEANILWARQLEQAGVHVVYGLIGFKTHSKLALVVRREGGTIRRYVHLGTGNYDTETARSYSDLSLFTANEAFGADATALLNLLTGYSKPPNWRKLLVSPLGLKQSILQLIDEEARAGAEGRIVAKMNALADPEVIKALYRASQAGVHVDLLVRGICCLRPGVPGVSERIRVTSVVDRFLEHARIWHFHARGAKKVYLASGDWMPRNFVRRVDIAFPVETPALKERVLNEILGTMLADNVKARILRPDGTYERARGGDGPSPAVVRSQEQFMALARRAAFSDASRSPAIEPLLAAGSNETRRRERRA